MAFNLLSLRANAKASSPTQRHGPFRSSSNGPEADEKDTAEPLVEDSLELDAPLVVDPRAHEIVKLNVGGVLYTTTRGTLLSQPQTFFHGVLSDRFDHVRDDNGAIFIDRDGDHFAPLLNFLRSGEFNVPPHLNRRQVYSEAVFYNIHIPKVSHELHARTGTKMPVLFIAADGLVLSPFHDCLLMGKRFYLKVLSRTALETLGLVYRPRELTEPQLVRHFRREYSHREESEHHIDGQGDRAVAGMPLDAQHERDLATLENWWQDFDHRNRRFFIGANTYCVDISNPKKGLFQSDIVRMLTSLSGYRVGRIHFLPDDGSSVLRYVDAKDGELKTCVPPVFELHL